VGGVIAADLGKIAVGLLLYTYMRDMPSDTTKIQKQISFPEALASGDIQAIRAFPKADLHTHGLANADRAYVFEKTGRDIVPVANST